MAAVNRRRVPIAAIAIVCAATAAGGRFIFLAQQPRADRLRDVGAGAISHGPRAAIVDREEVERQISSFCGACHAMPRPASFPKAAWPKEVAQGFEFYRESGRTDLPVPPEEEVVAWFESRAPAGLTPPLAADEDDSSALTLRKDHWPRDGSTAIMEIAHLHRLKLENDQFPVLLYCDMFSGEVGWVRPGEASTSATVLAWLSHPCHVEPCDLDQDGNLDLVAADLGSFEPADHARGRVVWLRPSGGEALWQTNVLLAGLGRVADVQPGDFDGDGDIDLVVAEFGWRRTGRILLLENMSAGDTGIPEFTHRVVDARHGAIHVPAVDLNGDGRLDFVALISQEHEVVEAFLNAGDGTFRRQTIFAAGDPAFGSSGIQLVDLDGDGDIDVLYTNGDSLDSNIAKPYHAIHWLENKGDYPFEEHQLTAMPGVSRALAGDLDGDGLLDIVAVAYLPDAAVEFAAGAKLDSLIWLRQTAEHDFIRRPLERGRPQYVSLEVFDADGDGAPDIFGGSFSGSPGRIGPRIRGWWNRSKGQPPTP